MSQAERPQIVVQDVLNMLKKGMTREEIRLHYGLKKTDLKRLFKHEKLIGKKTHAKPAFVIVDREADSPQPRPAQPPSTEPVAEQVMDDSADDFRNPVSNSSEEEDLSGRETFGG